MTRNEAIEDACHKINGYALDILLTPRRGAELSIALKGFMRHVASVTGGVWDQATQQSKPAANGNGHQPKGAAK